MNLNVSFKLPTAQEITAHGTRAGAPCAGAPSPRNVTGRDLRTWALPGLGPGSPAPSCFRFEGRRPGLSSCGGGFGDGDGPGWGAMQIDRTVTLNSEPRLPSCWHEHLKNVECQNNRNCYVRCKVVRPVWPGPSARSDIRLKQA